MIILGEGPHEGSFELQGEAKGGRGERLFSDNAAVISIMIEQELNNLLDTPRPFASVLISSEVDPTDPAFQNPANRVGPIYAKAEAERLR